MSRLSTHILSHLSAHLYHHHHSHHPSLLHSFTPGSKPTFSTNPFHLRLLSPTGRGINLSATLWGSLLSPPHASPPFPFSPLPLEVGPLNPAKGSGGALYCKLPQWGLGRSPSRQRFWWIFRVKERCWWHSRCTVWNIKKGPFFTLARLL